MKFKIWFDPNERVLCEFCGGENVKLLADGRFCEDEGVLAFYNCSECGQLGFWPDDRRRRETGSADSAAKYIPPRGRRS